MNTTEERVHTMTDYYDGPRGGVADFHGRPHVYESLWSDLEGDWTDLFLLMPIDEELLRLAVESHAIFERWADAHRKGLVDLSTHPALPSERERHDEIERLVGKSLDVDRARAFTVEGQFGCRNFRESEGMERREQVVTWVTVALPEANLRPASELFRGDV